ncbi:MAG: DUF2807 domain-containing protein [Maricaulaceae bacterium]
MTYTYPFKTSLIAGLTLVSFSSLSTTAFAQETVTFEIENFIGRLTITNGDEVSIKGADANTLSEQGNVWRIDGDEEINVTSCRANNSRVELSFGSWSWLGRSGGYKNLDEYPHLKVTLPDNANLKLSDSVIYGDIADLGAADITLNYCADMVLGSVERQLKLEILGSADLQADTVGYADVTIRGSGDLSLEQVGDFTLSVNGSGDVDVETINGTALISSKGSGDIEIDDLVGNFEYRSQGSGDLSIDELRGDKAYISVNGSGDVEIDAGDVVDLSIKTNGSGGVDYGGRSDNVFARSNGSSDIYVKTARAEVTASANGSGSVKVDGVRYERD